jgi:hypothetical protein
VCVSVCPCMHNWARRISYVYTYIYLSHLVVQLYGFHKTTQDPEVCEFQHKYFKRDQVCVCVCVCVWERERERERERVNSVVSSCYSLWRRISAQILQAWLGVSVCVCVRGVCVRVCVILQAWPDVCVCVCVCVCHVYIYVSVCVCVYIYTLCIYIHALNHTHVSCQYICIYMYICVHYIRVHSQRCKCVVCFQLSMCRMLSITFFLFNYIWRTLTIGIM